MTCYYPIDAWKSQTVNESGKRSIVFRRNDGFADMHLQVPCGKCVGCYADRALMWSIRIYHEASLHERNSFITLTYADPPPEFIEKKHLQDFFKRARNHFDFRYFAVGEYGEQTRRPHYHACIFGEDFLAVEHGYQKISETLYTSKVLEELWGHGLVSVGRLEMGSCCYVAGYVNKKIGDDDTFSLMSRRPGIGHDWIDKYKDDLIRTGKVCIDGRELPVPSRYLTWHEEDFVELKKKRKAIFDNMSPEEVFERRRALPHQEINRAASIKMKRGTL